MSRKRAKRRNLIATLLAVVVILILILVGLLIFLLRQTPTAEPEAIPAQTAATEEASTENTIDASPEVPTEAPSEEPAAEPATEAPEFHAAADGSKTSAKCKVSYAAASPENGSKAVATAGSSQLTNAQLQSLYLFEVNNWKNSTRETAPDFTRPLDVQQCPLGDGSMSWQQYFLQKAITGWQVQQAIIEASKEPQIITEEAYKPNFTTDLHGTYISPTLPVNNFLYQDLPCYTPNKLHQAYLDGLEAQLDDLAKSKGYAGLDDYAAKLGSTSQEIVENAQQLNLAYMYFTEHSYAIELEDEAVQQYIDAHRSELPGDGSHSVDFRQILMIPDGAQVAPDGTVTAEDIDWDRCRKSAESLASVIRVSSYGYTFAQQANLKSQDAGSKINGGLYTGITAGQLIRELDEWCFDSSRKVNDLGIVRSSLGYHIVKITAITPAAEAAAREAMKLEQQKTFFAPWLEQQKASADYSAVSLWADTTKEAISLDEVLYPDIAHERFPEAIVYLQQDFMYAPFGTGDVGHNGCGITAMAMLTTYMTDTIQSPAMMAKRFPQYFIDNGTDGNIFLYGVIDMGFFPDYRAFSVDEMIPALKNHQPVISIQRKGLFTSTGHYLLLQNYYEENDTYQVRDSNVYNYGRLEGHKVDAFTRRYITSGGAEFYIMQPKITRIPACARCGTTFSEGAPESLMQRDYCCEKCTAALSRRNQFLTVLTGL